MIQRCLIRACVTASVLAIGLAHSLPASAQTSAADDKPKEPKLVIELKALTETFEGLREKPSDSVATNGGDMEAAILSAFAIDAAATEIHTALNNEKSIVVVGLADSISADIYASYQAEYAEICDQLVGDERCGVAVPSRVGGAIVPVIAAILPFFSSLLRSETEIAKLDGGLSDDRLLAYAVAKKFSANAVVLVPPSLTSIPPDDETIAELRRLKIARDEVQRTLPKKNPNKKLVAAVAAADSLQKALFTADKEGSIKLISVIRARLVASGRSKGKLLRVHIEKSGGTLLIRKNIAVAFGAPAVAVTGGLIATYVIDSGKGYSEGQGMVVCQTRLANLRTVHRLKKTDMPACQVF